MQRRLASGNGPVGIEWLRPEVDYLRRDRNGVDSPDKTRHLPAEQAAPAPIEAAEPAAVQYSPDVQRLLAIEVPVIVQLGVRRMNVGEVMRLAVGAIIEFSKSAEEELELLANNKSIGKGHAVKVGENFGIKLTGIGSVKETIRKLGGA